ncbi:aldehyde dehydrogenase family protein [Nocardia sp. CA-135953]|uniref:aldehyde dehydrogenase family protein n=1 Tax=Nocardia sp. CA-135953 TaxID=3239978 RepID=UPI003D979F58
MVADDRSEIYVGGRWVDPRLRIDLIDPSTEMVFTQAPMAETAAVDDAVESARAAFDSGPWPQLSRKERLDVLLSMSAYLEEHASEYGDQLLRETGLPRPFARGGVFAAAGHARYLAGIYESYPWTEKRQGVTGVNTLLVRAAVGVVAAIVPWNSPFSLAASKLMPALLAGCTVILKASPINALSLLAFADAAEHAGLPQGVLSVFAAGPEPSQRLVTHPGVDKVAFTGSDATGAAIAASAGPLFKRLTLELGGKSAGIVLPDCSLDRLRAAVPPAFTLNNGEACAAMTRMLVPRARAEEITSAVAAEVDKLVVGDPRDPATDIGPLVNKAQYERVMGYIAGALEDGGRAVCGGSRPDHLDVGYYVRPTIIEGVGPNSKIAQDELFGPVLTVLPYDDIDEAVAIANGTRYGLSSAVFGEDEDQLNAVGRRLRSGSVHFNNGFTVDIGIPFGGFKASGTGREFGPEGIDPYVETKAVFLDGQPYRARR